MYLNIERMRACPWDVLKAIRERESVCVCEELEDLWIWPGD